MPLELERRAGPVPEATDAGQPVALSGGRADDLAYRLSLLGAKGRSALERWGNSSLSTVGSPASARGRAISSFWSSLGRHFSAARPSRRPRSRPAIRTA
jgi:hypothetical protein